MDESKSSKPTMTGIAHTAGLIAGALSGATGESAATRDLFASIQGRRSHKKFKPGVIPRERIELLLENAVLAPNHKMTQPWGFLVLGERAQHAYAETKARLKLAGQQPAAVADKSQKMMAEVMSIPVILGVTQRVDEDPEREREDYAAVFMAIQNLLLSATAMGLGTKLHTGDILEDGWLRDALQVNDRERIVAFIDVGEPAEELPPKKRIPASEKTRWLL
jgi:nitroreductase